MIKIYILSNDISFIRSFDSLFDKVDYKIEKLSIKPEEVLNEVRNDVIALMAKHPYLED